MAISVHESLWLIFRKLNSLILLSAELLVYYRLFKPVKSWFFFGRVSGIDGLTLMATHLQVHCWPGSSIRIYIWKIFICCRIDCYCCQGARNRRVLYRGNDEQTKILASRLNYNKLPKLFYLFIHDASGIFFMHFCWAELGRF